MGGNAFKNLELIRINRGDVFTTVLHVVNTINLDGFTLDYAMNSLMGSTGKKTSSGDVDFCMNTYSALFYGEKEYPVFDKHIVLGKIQKALPQSRINTHTFKMGNLMTAFPINGNENNGLIQVDFVFGKHDLLMFTHYSPSEEESRFPGVMLSQGFGILCKMNKFYEEFDPENGERIARVGWHLSLEKGLFQKFESRRRVKMGCSETTPEEFETRFSNAPRFPRIGYIDDPETIVHMLLGYDVNLEDVRTFENLVKIVKTKFPDKFDEFRRRFIASVKTSGMMKRFTPEEVANDPVWNV